MEYHSQLQSAARSLKSNLARIAYFGFRMRMSDGWTILGYESGPRGEDAYREMLDIPRSTYFKAVRIGQALNQLSLADLERIPTSNAELLIQVDPSITHDFAWVKEAQLLKPKDMAELVASRNKAVGGREPLSTIVFKVAFLAKQAVETMLESVQKKYELSSKGQALELMIADLHNDANLISSVEKAKQLLAGVAKSIKLRNGFKGDEETWMQMALEVLDEGYEKAVQTAREKSNGSKKNGGQS